MTKPMQRAATERTKPPVALAPAKSFEKAKPEWRPLHMARMRFFPTYATEKTFPREVADLVRRSTTIDVTIADAKDDYEVQIVFGGVGLLIDAAKGEIEIEADLVGGNGWETIFSDYTGIRGTIDSFPRILQDDAIKPQYRDAAHHQHQLALRLIDALNENFRHAVASGAAELFGRWRDLQSPFQPVFSDQWARLTETPGAEWSPGTDVSTITGSGERGDLTIYSIHVCPHQKQESASNLALIQCAELLSSRMKGSPFRIPFEVLLSEARQRWNKKQLPDRAVQKIFRDVKKSIKSPLWHTRGPVPSLVQGTNVRSRA